VTYLYIIIERLKCGSIYGITDQDGRIVVISMALTAIGFVETMVHFSSIVGKEIRLLTEIISGTGMFLCAGDFVCRVY
jgi:hypothetical protein